MRLLVRGLNSACRLLGAFALLGMLIAPAPAQTTTTSTPQSHLTTPVIGWGVTGSAPQTGSSAYTSGKAFSVPNGQPGAVAPPTSKHAIQPSAPSEPTPKAAEAPASKILVVIDKPTQEMKVFVGNVERYTWAVSTGKRGYDTPSGTYTARSMNEIWYSKQWDAAPMPHAIFFTKKGHAIHGIEETKKLGRPASHGCVRLAPENASTLFALVKEIGVANTEVMLNGDTPSAKVKVASHEASKQQIKEHKKTAAALKRASPSGKSRVASFGPRQSQNNALKKNTVVVLTGPGGTAKVTNSGLPRQEIKQSRKVASPSFAQGELERPRRLSRREWMQLYYSAPPQLSLPKGRYELSPGQRRPLRHYERDSPQ
jgi:lipoprotein-anchoring transpeptidase ErfK/SrfK